MILRSMRVVGGRNIGVDKAGENGKKGRWERTSKAGKTSVAETLGSHNGIKNIKGKWKKRRDEEGETDLFPSSRCALTTTAHSRLLNFVFLISGAKLLNQRSRHCLLVLPGTWWLINRKS